MWADSNHFSGCEKELHQRLRSTSRPAYRNTVQELMNFCHYSARVWKRLVTYAKLEPDCATSHASSRRRQQMWLIYYQFNCKFGITMHGRYSISRGINARLNLSGCTLSPETTGRDSHSGRPDSASHPRPVCPDPRIALCYSDSITLSKI